MEKRGQSVLAILLFFIIQNCGAQNFDINTLKKINLSRNKKLDNLFCGISNSVSYTTIAMPLSYYTIGLIKKDKKLQQQAFVDLAAIGLNSIVTIGLKNSVNRPRPAVTYPYLSPLEGLTKHSFPSGHTSLAFCDAMNFSLCAKKWYYVAPAFAYASLVGYSRMHLGVHYPSDVVAGAIIGVGSAYIAYVVNKKWQGKKCYKNFVNKLTF
jgi:membrane-associated phospholipid phosphatase